MCTVFSDYKVIIYNHIRKYCISYKIKFNPLAVFLDYSCTMSFKVKLKDEMNFQDIKPKELSEKTGISVNTIRNYINGHNALPNIYSAVKIARALNISVEELVDEGTPNAEKSPLCKKFAAMFASLSENDRKSVMALMTEMQSHGT